MKSSTRSTLPRCLICSEVCHDPTPPLEGGMEGATHCSSLEKHLLHLFILRELLDIPSSWCEQTLQCVDENGSPDSWFRVCSNCVSRWVDKAWQTYQKILGLESRMKTIKEDIREIMARNEERTRRGKFLMGGGVGIGIQDKIEHLIFSDQSEPSFPDNDDFDDDDQPDMPLEDYSYSDAEWTAPVDHLVKVEQPFQPLYLDDEFHLDDPLENGVYQQRKRKQCRQNPNRKLKIGRNFKKKKQPEVSDQSSPYWKYCKLCPSKASRFTDPQELESHLAAHEESRKSGGTYDCKICSFPARDSAELEVHTNHRHTNKRENKKYPCPHCEFVSLTWKVLKSHFQEEHPDIPEEEVEAFKLKCSVCGRDFEDLKSMMIHKKMSHPELFGLQEEAVSCDLCSRIFSNRFRLKSHINTTHLRVTKFICDTCGKGFRFLKYLERHKITHGKGNREFVCHVCGVDYSYDSMLLKHIAKFHPEASKKNTDDTAAIEASKNLKDLNCRYCDFKTPFKPVMIRHVESHKAEMGHQCDLCSKSYTSAAGLQRHLRINHASTNEVVNCPHCFKPFSNVEYMKNHEVKYCKLKHLKNNDIKMSSVQMEVATDEA